LLHNVSEVIFITQDHRNVSKDKFISRDASELIKTTGNMSHCSVALGKMIGEVR